MSEQSKIVIASPCIGVCVLDENNICAGCFRNVEEVAKWSGLSNDEKREVIARSWARARARGKVL
ncbi:MAG: DUF1289 domain-containing protein [Gammaproteobacteria bacterium]|nr:DUF1289 domain-containing protein [Gammaproteobacteria bacterium]NND38017.1 DUF1289 domain-containing protein [Pseudomonadales bacterium]NNL11652.1 DUF1289 domain-containing protein [Pseudomonadales bacterium]NNM12285.1 DUF1289 domain-containing protein [Pseudomonadales bacterium]RZV52376.1 MAG: DUF1289 domain-containing protein [Pseudomonadales bacterium]